MGNSLRLGRIPGLEGEGRIPRSVNLKREALAPPMERLPTNSTSHASGRVCCGREPLRRNIRQPGGRWLLNTVR